MFVQSWRLCKLILCSSVFLDKFLETREKMRRRKSINLLINVLISIYRAFSELVLNMNEFTFKSLITIT